MSVYVPFPSSKHLFGKSISFPDKSTRGSFLKIQATSDNGAAHPSASQVASSNAVGNMHRRLSSLESLFCYDKSVPEEIIEKPVGLSVAEKNIGNKTRCPGCEAKGAILCATCSGSGLYVDSIMESQGIIVKVRCLGSILLKNLPSRSPGPEFPKFQVPDLKRTRSPPLISSYKDVL